MCGVTLFVSGDLDSCFVVSIRTSRVDHLALAQADCFFFREVLLVVVC